MQHGHELSPAWRGAPWGKRIIPDWAASPDATPDAPHVWLPLGLSIALGVALGVTVAAGLARQDRARFDALMASVQADP